MLTACLKYSFLEQYFLNIKYLICCVFCLYAIQHSIPNLKKKMKNKVSCSFLHQVAIIVLLIIQY